MQKLVQNLKSGDLKIVDIPLPSIKAKYVLVKTHYSVLSPGTERATIKAGNKSIFSKAAGRPELVKQVIESVKTEGVINTYNKVQTKIDKWRGLGYSLSGEIVALGDGVKDFVIGDHVAAAGSEYANHAEYNLVPMNLVCKIPKDVASKDAAFSTIGSIALQGLRLAEPKLGDVCIVIGAGLIGLMAVKLLVANGCIVVSSDLDSGKERVAYSSGASLFTHGGSENVPGQYQAITKGRGFDHVFVAAASSRPELINFAGNLCREAGVVTVLGDINLDVDRNVFYEKEIKLYISRSYGPGRYDTNYEERGLDYPFAYVRWSEQRNIESILAMLAVKKISFDDLVTTEYEFQDILTAYDRLLEDKSLLGVRVKYVPDVKPLNVFLSHKKISPSKLSQVALLGVGSYATAYLLPFIGRRKDIKISHIFSAGGISANTYAEKYAIPNICTSSDEVMNNEGIGMVFIASRHRSHAEYICEALNRGKHVYVDKPICISPEELSQIEEAIDNTSGSLFVGTNRRYSQIIADVKTHITDQSPTFINMTIHAGPVPKKAWFHDEEEGNGMLVSEVIHFIDLATDIVQSNVKDVYARALSIDRDDIAAIDNIAITLYHMNGSVSTIQYMTISGERAPKEIIDVNHCGATFIVNNYEQLKIYIGKKTKIKKYSFDKGQGNMVKKLLDQYNTYGHCQAQTMDTILNNMEAVFAISEALRTGTPVHL